MKEFKVEENILLYNFPYLNTMLHCLQDYKENPMFGDNVDPEHIKKEVEKAEKELEVAYAEQLNYNYAFTSFFFQTQRRIKEIKRLIKDLSHLCFITIPQYNFNKCKSKIKKLI